jgi:S-adenosylmethionine synthetase
VIDAYGPRVPVGGGAYSGKCPTKVDRSAAYMARYIALEVLKSEILDYDTVLVKLAYAIGYTQPVDVTVIIDGCYD